MIEVLRKLIILSLITNVYDEPNYIVSLHDPVIRLEL